MVDRYWILILRPKEVNCSSKRLPTSPGAAPCRCPRGERVLGVQELQQAHKLGVQELKQAHKRFGASLVNMAIDEVCRCRCFVPRPITSGAGQAFDRRAGQETPPWVVADVQS